MNDRLKQALALEEAIKKWEKLDHSPYDDTYYTALYKMQQALRAIMAECNIYIDRKTEREQRLQEYYNK